MRHAWRRLAVALGVTIAVLLAFKAIASLALYVFSPFVALAVVSLWYRHRRWW